VSTEGAKFRPTFGHGIVVANKIDLDSFFSNLSANAMRISKQERIMARISMGWGIRCFINSETGNWSMATEHAYPRTTPL
jgi:hypothetical protein